MSVTDEALKANQAYARNFTYAGLPATPARKLAVLACTDARLFLDRILGLDTGDAHIIRNAGGIASEDALRSLVISHHLLGTQEFIIINHTDCGMPTFKDDELLTQLEQKTGVSIDSPTHFHAFENLEANVRQQIDRVKSHPWIPASIPVRGFIYDVHTGKLTEVDAESTSAYA